MNMINKIKSGQIRLAIIGMGQILEGVADHMVDHQPRPFLPADLAVPNEDDLVKILKDTRAVVVRWSLLSANNRSIAIFLFCIAGQPLAYFIFEIVILSLLMLRLNTQASSTFVAQLDL
jgi:hypothetical protein